MRPYLEGYHFTVVTDHQSLRWLHSLKSPPGRLARWSIYLQQFDFEIKYRRGVLNKVADALSRDSVLSALEDVSESVALIEEFEPCCKKMAVESNPNQFSDYCIQDNRLYRQFWDVNEGTNRALNNPWKLCVFKTARDMVLRQNHDEPTAGDLGIAKNYGSCCKEVLLTGDDAGYCQICPQLFIVSAL